MNIGELARQAEVTPRTIRYYVEQGLLPPPERGYPAEYTAEHVERLELIKLLKNERLPLEEIRATMQRLEPSEVSDLIGKAQRRVTAQAVAPSLDSAADYIARVLESRRERDELLDTSARQKVLPAPAPLAPPMAAQPVPDLAALPLPVMLPGAAQPATPAPTELEDAGTWQRIRLTPSVEIHYQVTADDEHRNLVDRLVDLAARLLGRGPEKG